MTIFTNKDYIFVTMKTKLLWLLSLLFVFTACAGDDPTEDPTPGPPATPVIDIPASENIQPVIGTNGGSATLSFTTTHDWTATTEAGSAGWLSFSPTTGSAGKHTLLMSATANETYDSRTAIITLKSGTVTRTIEVTQMQRDALVVAHTDYRVAQAGGALDFEVQTNADLSVTINVPWITQATTRGIRTETLHFDILTNDDEMVRMATITLKAGSLSQNILITQDGSTEGASSERDILMALYHATNGDRWQHRDNWGSDRPLGEWYGVQIDSKGHVFGIDLSENNLTGYLPSELCGLTCMAYLYLKKNHLTGTLPEEFGQLTSLQNLWISENQLSGTIPTSLCQLTKLRFVAMDHNLFTGSIPEEIGNLSAVYGLFLCNNQLTGDLPSSIGNLKKLEQLWLNDNQFTGGIPSSFMNLTLLKELLLQNNLMDGEIPESMYTSAWWKQLDLNISQRAGHRLTYANLYASTDYSHDGEVTLLQQHQQGKGIPIIITGEAFSDRLIADGTFKSAATRAMNAFFGKEPYTTFRDYFDVYMVSAVSMNEMIDENTVFWTKHQGSYYSINDIKVMTYVQLVPELSSNLEDVTAVVILNERGMCRVHSDWYSSGFTIGLCTLGDMEYEVQHEVGGHGFAKLADEYWDDDTSGTTFPEGSKTWVDMYHDRGWYLNVDYNNDPQTVLWKDFISNTSYKVEAIGIYEGGLSSYSYGIYRPTETSIMRDHTSSYNAPSRWAIYQMIMKQSGEPCTYEDFLQYDKKNLASTRSQQGRTIPRERLGAPVRIHQ